MVKIKEDNWKIIKNSGNVKIVDFYAEWCGPCKTLGKIFEELEENSEGIDFFKADVEECLEASDEFEIKSVPTVIILKNGEVKEKLVGVQPASKYESLLKFWKEHD